MTRSSSLRATDDRVELASRAIWVRLRPNWSRIWLLPPFSSSPLCRRADGSAGRALLAAAAAAASAGRTLVTREQLDDLLANAAEVGPELDEHLRGNAFALADEAEQDVLGADVVVTELQRFAQRELEHLLGARREGNVTRRRRAALTDDLLDLAAHRFE